MGQNKANHGLFMRNLKTMNVNINNNSGQQVYASFYGIDTNCNWCLYNFSSNTLDVCVISSAGTTDAMSYMTPVGPNGLNISNVQPLASGIVLFTYNQLPNDFAVVADGNGVPTVQCPSFLSGTSDYDTVFNMIELTFTATTSGGAPAVWADITNVDFFATPVIITLSGSNAGGAYYQSKGAMTVGRDAVFAGYLKKTKGTVFENLVVTGASGNIRILAPQHGVTGNLIPTNYWDAYVNAMWKLYTKKTLTVTTNYGTYTGHTTSGQLKFVNVANVSEIHVFPKPGPGLASDIFGCAGTLAAPNDARGAIAAVVGAAINRSTILSHTNQPDCTVTDFYKLKNSSNLYASALHKFYADGTTYAFPFDDVCNGSSTLSCTTPELLTINLTTF